MGKNMRWGGVLLALLVALLVIPARAAWADTVEVSTYEELQTAVWGVKDSREIVVARDIELESAVRVPRGTDIVLTDHGAGHTLSFAGGSGPVFSIPVGASLALDVSVDASKVTNSYQREGLIAEVAGSLSIEGGTYSGARVTSAYSGCFYVVGDQASMTINGGTISNNSCTNQDNGVVYVSGGASLLMTGGSIADNNASADVPRPNTAAVYLVGYDSEHKKTVDNASFTMTGGSITGNQGYVGGVLVGSFLQPDYVSTASFTMSGGTISGNTARYMGGGVGVVTCGSFYFEGGTISGNTAPYGGGVATFDMYKSIVEAAGATGSISIEAWGERYNVPARFEMSGGAITGNHAKQADDTSAGCGGGLYVASNTCSITGGDISNNAADRQGGGIYVSSTPYVLHMSNALVTGNTATLLGGGMWLCPTGDVEVAVTNGAAITGNEAVADGSAAAGDDVVAVPQEGKTYLVTLADRLLGGGAVSWYGDGGVVGGTPLGAVDADVPRYDHTAGAEPLGDITDSADALALKGVASDEALSLASELARVTITGNTSERGGGIGTNGGIVMGEPERGEWSLSVTKAWDGVPEEERKSVTVRLKIGDHVLDEVTLSAENGWTASFSGLPDPASLGDLTLGVVEDGNEYEVSYGQVSFDEATHTMSVTVTNAPKDRAPAAACVSARKELVGGDLSEGQFSFELVDEGGAVVSEVANAADGSVSFPSLTFENEGTYRYELRERNDAQAGVIYDETVYDVVVTVTEDGDGRLHADVGVFEAGSGAPVESGATFVNRLEQPPVPEEVPEEDDDSGTDGGGTEDGGAEDDLPRTGETASGATAVAGAGLAVTGSALVLRRRSSRGQSGR